MQKYIVEPAAAECGFTTLRADAISETGIITSQIIDHLFQDPMVVADLSGHNPNVFYELAIRHAIGRPYVQIINETDPLPFDVAGIRSVQFNHQDLDSVEAARNDIVKHMRAMESGERVPSPITVAVDIASLNKSTRQEDRQLGEVLTAVAELKQQINVLQHQTINQALNTPNSYLNFLASPDNRFMTGPPNIDIATMTRLMGIGTETEKGLKALAGLKERKNIPAEKNES